MSQLQENADQDPVLDAVQRFGLILNNSKLFSAVNKMCASFLAISIAMFPKIPMDQSKI